MSEKFWILESPKKRTARWDRGNVWRKSDYNGFIRSTGGGKFLTYGGPANRISELKVVLQYGSIPDFIWTITDCLVRSDILDMMKKEGFSGFEAKQARVRWDPFITAPGFHDDEDDWGLAELISDDESPMFYELLTTGWGGLAADGCGISRVESTNTWEGYADWTKILDYNSWDGSDFFIIWPFGFTRVVTNRVAEFIRKSELSGVKLTSMEEYMNHHKLCKPGRIIPMRLRDHFPDKLAKAIGEPLGIY